MENKTIEALKAIENIPTFELTPVHKPDMSPYLVHLTSRENLLNIVAGEGAPTGLCQNQGFLKSSMPNYTTSKYHNKVVSFTESPIHALDFFRLRSQARYKNDQQYGIGFSKSALVKQGVRPVLYLDKETNAALLGIIENADKDFFKISNNSVSNEYLKKHLSKLKSLMFPLFENSDKQGFMWEREWRWPNSEGMVFNLTDIRVICCPNSNQAELIKLLYPFSKSICFVENWSEYDNYTLFIKSKNELPRKDDISGIFDLNEIKSLQDRYMQMLISLNAYRDNFTEKDTYDWKYFEKAMDNLYSNFEECERQKNVIQTYIDEQNNEMMRDYHAEVQRELEAEWQREYYADLSRDIESNFYSSY
ncbi:abortive infection system antitoxin AbiGi family protein [Sphingobacterium multivorum]|uniref:abortive infection system antitoxin AbiGi family protein n=1 Tax=Sphingobacterium multivorum TaxID=28454 RepID=UPI003DA630A9